MKMYCCWTSELRVVGGAYPATGELEAVFVAWHQNPAS